MVIAFETGSLGAGTSAPNLEPISLPSLPYQATGGRSRCEPISLTTHVWDDGLPKPRRESTNTAEELNQRMMRRPTKVTVEK